MPVCPVLSVTLVHCGQTVGQIKMKLGKQVGLGPRQIVLDGDSAPPPPKGHIPQSSAYICCGQMAAWIKMPLSMELGLGPGDFVRWEPRSCLPKGGRLRPPPKFFFRPCLLWPNGWMDQDATWYSGSLIPGHIVLEGDPAPLPKRGAEPPHPTPFSARVCCGQTAGWIKVPLDREVDVGPRRHRVTWGPSSPKWAQPSISGPCVLWPNGCMDQGATWY